MVLRQISPKQLWSWENQARTVPKSGTCSDPKGKSRTQLCDWGMCKKMCIFRAVAATKPLSGVTGKVTPPLKKEMSIPPKASLRAAWHKNKTLAPLRGARVSLYNQSGTKGRPYD